MLLPWFLQISFALRLSLGFEFRQTQLQHIVRTSLSKIENLVDFSLVRTTRTILSTAVHGRKTDPDGNFLRIFSDLDMNA